MSHKFTGMPSENEPARGGKGKSKKIHNRDSKTGLGKKKVGIMNRKELKKFFGHSFPPMPKKVKEVVA